MKAVVTEVPATDFAGHGIVPLGRHGDPPGPEWFAAAARSLRDNLRNREYPCHFGRQAFDRGQLLITYVSVDDLAPLAGALAYFLDSTPRIRGGRHLLCTFIRSSGDQTHQDHDRHFWQVLQYLHDHDPAPWPAGFPLSPEDPAWEFCFNGEPMFVFGAASTHVARASRNLGEHLVLLFQPRSVFLGIEGGTPAGVVARSRIRDRLRAWDLAAPHPSMGDYGDPSNFEWRQYFIPDDGADLHPACPLRLHEPAADGGGPARETARGGRREEVRT